MASALAGAGWHGATLPQAAGAYSSAFRGITALPDGTAWAVGLATTTSQRAAAQHWDGHQWAAVRTPDLNGDDRGGSVLNAVSASAPDDAWAVGSTATSPQETGAAGSGYKDSSLIEHWNGLRWSAVGPASRPVLPDSFATLAGVAAISATEAWAVGSNGTAALIEHWDGTRWSVSPYPDLHSDINGSALYSVAAGPAGGVWAVGEVSVAGRQSCLIEHWNGSSWQNVACPAPADAGKAKLLAVTELSPRDLWAVGFYTTGDAENPDGHALIDHFDGTGWSLVPAPRTSAGAKPAGAQSDELWAVAGRSADDVYAIDPTGGVVHWDGTQWTLSSYRAPGRVEAMAALPGGRIWAIGYSGQPSRSLVIAENP